MSNEFRFLTIITAIIAVLTLGYMAVALSYAGEGNLTMVFALTLVYVVVSLVVILVLLLIYEVFYKNDNIRFSITESNGCIRS